MSGSIQTTYSGNYSDNYNVGNGEVGSIEVISHDAKRKLIFEASLRLETEDFEGLTSKIRGELLEDEWLDNEKISNNSANFTVRIKTERLDDYLEAIQAGQRVISYEKKATDITLKYQEKSNLLLSYELERERLLVLYEGASLSDMLTINKRLSEIDVEIRNLNGELAEYDSLLEYSTIDIRVDISVGGRQEGEEELTFGQQLGDSLKSGWNALLKFFQFILLVLVTLLPWMIVIIPVLILVVYLMKRSNKKETLKKEKEETQQQTNQSREKKDKIF